MAVSIEELRPHLQAFDFPSLFVEGLGWNYYQSNPLTIDVDGSAYVLTPVAEKGQFAVFECGPGADGAIPPLPVRRKIEAQAEKYAHEHLILFVDAQRSAQVWQWAKREHGKTAAYRNFQYRAGDDGTPLLQRIRSIAFALDEEGSLTIAGIASRVRAAMDVEKVTKRFYEDFQRKLTDFGNFIDGIAAQGDRDWYASLMLNRMMFVYFVQKQGYLDGDADYLRNRLATVRQQAGGGRFQQFYRIFLLRLFHEGLGKPEAQRESDLAALLGKVPFLNGGLFDVHDLEKDNPDISIPDEAFERVFNFFDGYRWHLDERPYREDNEINPDVLGYIFEKYVNQKQMGAYYTKEDITGYISRNTVIPFLFDAARKECPVAFGPDGGVWRLLRDDPDRYIYPAVGHGIAWNARQAQDPKPLDTPLALPDEIAAGGGDVSKRGGWNRPAPDDYALPTETWREVVARRQRHAEVRAKLAAGEVREVNDLITLNLDIERFAKDVIAQSEGPELLRAFWHAMRDVSVLDPTCGSGAFLFAALNILEPLYTACLEGMRGFLDDEERIHRRGPNYLSDFKDVQKEAKDHPSERYFILKSIVLNNLYGVDIMEEAVEICKLRLFLKLVAQLETYDQIEPLPDIDFNVRAGNTLVGFTSLDAVRQAMTIMPNGQHRQVFPEDQATLDRIEEAAEGTDWMFNEFRRQQTPRGGQVTSAAKQDLRERLRSLADELDRYLATEYGVNPSDQDAYAVWRDSHQPFHWFVEFYGTMVQGGFDVVIGNPPYVSRRRVHESYTPKGFVTAGCPDIYATVVERGVNVCRTNGRASMIVPLSLTFNRGFDGLRGLLYEECAANWFSSFGRIPSALFSAETRVRNTIWIGWKDPKAPKHCFTTRLHRWFTDHRRTLFDDLSYAPYAPASFEGLVPKLGNARMLSAFEYLLGGNYRFFTEISPSHKGHQLHFKKVAYNWLTFCSEQPPTYENGNLLPESNYGTVYFTGKQERDLSLLLGNSKIVFLWWVAMGDDFNVTHGGLNAPLSPSQLPDGIRDSLLEMVPDLERIMAENVVFKLNADKNVGNYNLTRCRHITDRVDRLWLEALGLSDLWEEIELEHALVVRTPYDSQDKA